MCVCVSVCARGSVGATVGGGSWGGGGSSRTERNDDGTALRDYLKCVTPDPSTKLKFGHSR